MNILCVVTNNKTRLKTLLDNLPENKNFQMVYVTDPRISKVDDVLSETDILYTSTEILEEFYSIYSSNNNTRNYALGYKMLVPWFLSNKLVFDKLLMIDDDIIITEKINDMFENVQTPASTSDNKMIIFNNDTSITNNLKKRAYEINGIDYTTAIKCVNGGHLLFTKKVDFNDYILKVKDYLSSYEVSVAISNQKNWLDFYMDEIFFSCLYHQYNNVYGGAYNLNGFVNFKTFKLYSGKMKNIYSLINEYAITHFAGMNDTSVYKKLKELNYVKD